VLTTGRFDAVFRRCLKVEETEGLEPFSSSLAV